jgi:DNA polymerase
MKDVYFKYATETVVFSNFCMSFDGGCTRCSLSEHGCKPIIYRGNPKTNIMLIGEAPGKVEQEENRPFAGPAGKLLDKIFESIELGTENLFITNSVFCRPIASEDSGKQNYTPKEEQLAKCWPFVENLIQIVRPKIIIACGKVALSQLKQDSKVRLKDYEGQWSEYKNIPLFTMIHPAAILHKSSCKKDYDELKLKVKTYMEEFKNTWQKKMENK